MRVFAYLFVIFAGLCAVTGTIVLIWGVTRGAEFADREGTVAAILLILFWSWGAFSMYERHIKRPRLQRKEAVHYAEKNLARIVNAEPLLSSVLMEVGKKCLTTEPRYRTNSHQLFDTVVQFEADSLAVSLFVKDGVVTRWQIEKNEPTSQPKYGEDQRAKKQKIVTGHLLGYEPPDTEQSSPTQTKHPNGLPPPLATCPWSTGGAPVASFINDGPDQN